MTKQALLLAGGVLLGVAGSAYLLSRSPPPPPVTTASARPAQRPPPPRRSPPTPKVVPAPSRAAAEVLAALRDERDPAARRALVAELARYPDAASLLREVYRSEADGAVREETLSTAAIVGNADAVGFLAEVAGSDEKLGARAGAALGSVADPRAAGALAALLGGEAKVIVRANAARALGASGDASQAEALAALVSDGSQALRVRQEAALALGSIGEPSVVPVLASTLDRAASEASPETSQLRISIVQALGAIGGEPAHAALARHLARELPEAERAFTRRALN
jgi:HEAT repeat protein